jgi:ubiquitin-conjugating enzyme E2 Q
VKGATDSVTSIHTVDVPDDTEVQVPGRKGKKKKRGITPHVRLDPQHRTQMGGKVIVIPDPAFQLETILDARNADYVHEDADAEDLAIFQLEPKKVSASNSQSKIYDLDDDDDYLPVASSSMTKVVTPILRPRNDWKHDAKYVDKTMANLMLPPFQSTPLASLAIQRELKSMIKEQDAARSLKELGWYLPPELIGDNLYQWIVEMHSFDPTLPIAKDMKAKYVWLSPVK